MALVANQDAGRLASGLVAAAALIVSHVLMRLCYSELVIEQRLTEAAHTTLIGR
jgi:hypothetical protein